MNLQSVRFITHPHLAHLHIICVFYFRHQFVSIINEKSRTTGVFPE